MWRRLLLAVGIVVAVVGELAYAEGIGDDPAPALPPGQKALLAALEATGRPVIVVVMAGRQARPEFPLGPFYVKDLALFGFAMFNAAPDEQRECATEEMCHQI